MGPTVEGTVNGNTSAHQRPRSLGRATIHRVLPVRGAIAALAFWSAIALPVIYLAWLLTGIETTGSLVAFLVLVAGHVTALIAGRHHQTAAAD